MEKALTCFWSTILAGRTFSTTAPSACKAKAFSAATSSGITIAGYSVQIRGILVDIRSSPTCIISSVVTISEDCLECRWWNCGEAHLDLATVAIDIPVEPTVPSNIIEFVYGYRSPCSSASSMTSYNQTCQFLRKFFELSSAKDSLFTATLSFTLPPGLRYCI